MEINAKIYVYMYEHLIELRISAYFSDRLRLRDSRATALTHEHRIALLLFSSFLSFFFYLRESFRATSLESAARRVGRVSFDS